MMEWQSNQDNQTTSRPVRPTQGEFLQILNTGSSHWILVSSIGCEDGEVNVYNFFHTEVQKLPDSTIRTISRLIMTSSPQLTLKMIEVERIFFAWLDTVAVSSVISQRVLHKS